MFVTYGVWDTVLSVLFCTAQIRKFYFVLGDFHNIPLFGLTLGEF